MRDATVGRGSDVRAQIGHRSEAAQPEGSLMLVVCTANVCRSPLAARVIQHALEEFAVVSAGTRAAEGAPMCEVSAAELADPDREFVHAHASRPVTRELVQRAGLVLTMEREQRSAIAQLAPGTQSKTFTLREALGLLEVLEGRSAAVQGDPVSIAKALHSVRGLGTFTPAEPARRWWQRRAEPSDPLTIVDGHGLGDGEHRAAAEQVHVTADAFAAAVLRLMTAS